jgi:outer membrane protein insertion porin family
VLKVTVESFLVIAFILLSAAPAYSQTAPPSAEADWQYRIESIDVVNNVSVRKERALSVVRSKVGDFFNEAVAQEDAERIGYLPGVAKVAWDHKVVGNKVRLRFVIEERNILSAIGFESVPEGERLRFKVKTLRSKLRFVAQDYVDMRTATSGVMDLKEFYQKKGFALVSVAMDYESVRGQIVRVTYRINEGPRVKIGTVRFVPKDGDKKRLRVKKKTLIGTVKSDNKEWFFWPKNYRKQSIEKDIIKLHRLYAKKGFLYNEITYRLDPDLLDATVIEEERKRRTRKVNITFEINEGPECLVEEVVFKFCDKKLEYEIGGGRHVDEEVLKKQLRWLEPGRTYRKHQAESDRKRVLKYYQEQGFVRANIEERGLLALLSKDELKAEEVGVPVEFRVYEGSRFKIGAVNITGNEWTQDRVIRRVLSEYAFEPNEPYDAYAAPPDGGGELEDEIRMRLLAEAITVRPGREYGYDPIEDVCTADVNVVITEGKTGEWNLGAGASSDRGFIGQIIYEQRNFDTSDKPKNFSEFRSVFWPSEFGEPPEAFLGAGQTLRVALEPGVEYSHYSVSFTEPYFRDKPIAFDLRGRSWEWERETHDEERLKAYLGFEERFQKRYRNKQWPKSIGFRLENVNIGNLEDDAPQEIVDDKGDTFLTGVKLGIGRNLTDDRFNPGKGYIINAGYEQVSGDHTFGILSGTHRWYRTLREDLAGRRTILATKLHASTILGDAPTFEKFYAGGSGFYGIRGFDYRGVSTRGLQRNVPNPERKDPIGSDWIFLASTEVVAPLVGEELAALFFIDSGAIDSGNYRVSVGTGIQIQIPRWFGPVPMRFEFAVPVMKDDEDETEVFSFSIGRLF